MFILNPFGIHSPKHFVPSHTQTTISHRLYTRDWDIPLPFPWSFAIWSVVAPGGNAPLQFCLALPVCHFCEMKKKMANFLWNHEKIGTSCTKWSKLLTFWGSCPPWSFCFEILHFRDKCKGWCWWWLWWCIMVVVWVWVGRWDSGSRNNPLFNFTPLLMRTMYSNVLYDEMGDNSLQRIEYKMKCIVGNVTHPVWDLRVRFRKGIISHLPGTSSPKRPQNYGLIILKQISTEINR